MSNEGASVMKNGEQHLAALSCMPSSQSLGGRAGEE